MVNRLTGFDEDGFPIDVEVPDDLVVRDMRAGSIDSASVVARGNLDGDPMHAHMAGGKVEFPSRDSFSTEGGSQDFESRVNAAVKILIRSGVAKDVADAMDEMDAVLYLRLFKEAKHTGQFAEDPEAYQEAFRRIVNMCSDVVEE